MISFSVTKPVFRAYSGFLFQYRRRSWRLTPLSFSFGVHRADVNRSRILERDFKKERKDSQHIAFYKSSFGRIVYSEFVYDAERYAHFKAPYVYVQYRTSFELLVVSSFLSKNGDRSYFSAIFPQ